MCMQHGDQRCTLRARIPLCMLESSGCGKRTSCADQDLTFPKCAPSALRAGVGGAGGVVALIVALVLLRVLLLPVCMLLAALLIVALALTLVALRPLLVLRLRGLLPERLVDVALLLTTLLILLSMLTVFIARRLVLCLHAQRARFARMLDA